MERLNWLGDTTEKGLRQSAGLMINYLYKLDDIIANHEAVAQRGEVIASTSVRNFLKQNDESRRGDNRQQGTRPFAHIMNSTLGGGRK